MILNISSLELEFKKIKKTNLWKMVQILWRLSSTSLLQPIFSMEQNVLDTYVGKQLP
jgi:hypothetical protein